jgi:hypothetical protein
MFKTTNRAGWVYTNRNFTVDVVRGKSVPNGNELLVKWAYEILELLEIDVTVQKLAQRLVEFESCSHGITQVQFLNEGRRQHWNEAASAEGSRSVQCGCSTCASPMGTPEGAEMNCGSR